MKVDLNLVEFSRSGGWEPCLTCRSAPGGKPTPETLVYYALGHRVCDWCVERGPEHIEAAIREWAEKYRRKAESCERALAGGVEIPEVSLEDRAKMELWARRQMQDHFGVCPACGKSCDWMNVHRTHWFYCDEHQVCWWVGSNHFSNWRREDEETWRQNEEKLRNFRVVYESIKDDLDLIPAEDALKEARSRISEISPDDFYDFPY